jgi:hypothetical protein
LKKAKTPKKLGSLISRKEELFFLGLCFLLGTNLLGLKGTGLSLGTFGELLKAINPASGIDKFLLAGIERMALGADFDTAGFDGRTCIENSPASAGDSCFFVIGWVDAGFHNGCIWDNKTKTL